MSLRVVRAVAETERSDEFHLARLLVLLRATSGGSNKPVEGIMKLAKMDFLLRYPAALRRALSAVGEANLDAIVPTDELRTIESKMIRFRYGPWDGRYRRWIGLLLAKGLAETYLVKRTINVKLTNEGLALADQLASLDEYRSHVVRAIAVAKRFNKMSATALKEFVYMEFPEIRTMKWGEEIQI